jgi:WD40 repeat protein
MPSLASENIAQKEWENVFWKNKNITCLALSPDAKNILVVDYKAETALVIDLTNSQFRFQIPSANAAASYSRDGTVICLAEYSKYSSSHETVAKLINAKSGEVIASLEGEFGGLLRNDSGNADSNCFYVRLSQGRIARLDFAGKRVEIVFDPRDLARDQGKVLLHDYDVRNSILFVHLNDGSLNDAIHCIDLNSKKEVWKRDVKKGAILYLNSAEEVCTNTTFRDSPYSIYHSDTGEVAHEFVYRGVRMLRNRESENLLLLREVASTQPNSFSRLQVVNTKGVVLSSSRLSKHKSRSVSNVVSANGTLFFARAGINGEVQVWSIPVEKQANEEE